MSVPFLVLRGRPDEGSEAYVKFRKVSFKIWVKHVMNI